MRVVCLFVFVLYYNALRKKKDIILAMDTTRGAANEYLDWRDSLPTEDMKTCAVAWYYGLTNDLESYPYFTFLASMFRRYSTGSFSRIQVSKGCQKDPGFDTKACFIMHVLMRTSYPIEAFEKFLKIAGPNATPFGILSYIRNDNVDLFVEKHRDVDYEIYTHNHPNVKCLYNDPMEVLRSILRYYYASSTREERLELHTCGILSACGYGNRFALLCGPSFDGARKRWDIRGRRFTPEDIALWRKEWFQPVNLQMISTQGTFACQDQLRSLWYIMKKQHLKMEKETEDNKFRLMGSRQIVFRQVIGHLYDLYGRMYQNDPGMQIFP